MQNIKYIYKKFDKFLDLYKKKKILFLIDEFYTFDPHANEELSLSKIIKHKNLNDFKIIYRHEEISAKNSKYDLVIDIFYSAKYINAINFYNKVLKITKINTKFLSFLPYSNFTNFSIYNYNPSYFEFINSNNNFNLLNISFLNDDQISINIDNPEQLKKLFFQSSPKKNQNFIDMVNNALINHHNICIVFDFLIKSLNQINATETLNLKRQARYLSGHSLTTHIDKGAISTIMQHIQPNSFIDIGCGPGGMVNYVRKKYNIKVIGIDGDDSIVRDNEDFFIIHDYALSKYEPDLIYDLAWCVEFLEHVSIDHINNYFATFVRTKNLFITHAPPGKKGYNHINCQNEDFWIDELTKIGFSVDWKLTKLIRNNSTLKKDFVRKHGLFFKNSRFFKV